MMAASTRKVSLGHTRAMIPAPMLITPRMIHSHFQPSTCEA